MGQIKGYKQSEEHKMKKSESLKKAYREGRHQGGFKDGNTALRMTGKKHTSETKKKQSEDKKINNPMFNEETRVKVSETRKRLCIGVGEKNHNWKGGITPENVRHRNSDEYKVWRKSVFMRDKYTCQKCYITKTIFNAHHIVPFSESIELRFEITNGITLCRKCHKEVESERLKNNKNGKRTRLFDK